MNIYLLGAHDPIISTPPHRTDGSIPAATKRDLEDRPNDRAEVTGLRTGHFLAGLDTRQHLGWAKGLKVGDYLDVYQRQSTLWRLGQVTQEIAPGAEADDAGSRGGRALKIHLAGCDERWDVVLAEDSERLRP